MKYLLALLGLFILTATVCLVPLAKRAARLLDDADKAVLSVDAAAGELYLSITDLHAEVDTLRGHKGVEGILEKTNALLAQMNFAANTWRHASERQIAALDETAAQTRQALTALNAALGTASTLMDHADGALVDVTPAVKQAIELDGAALEHTLAQLQATGADIGTLARSASETSKTATVILQQPAIEQGMTSAASIAANVDASTAALRQSLESAHKPFWVRVLGWFRR